ncbi:DUF4189 domain-containing protein [Stenotrophomonas sp. AN71]|uniref:DUF4189 domain-containing protein n=1 Tax=Stenotrophomonas sp. AN71 TaxID=3156253 RepID=UPI003D209CD3
MRVICSFLTWAVLSIFSLSAYAEGGSCPPGFYPIGGQGVQGCAPIPGASSGSGPAAVDAPPIPTGEWLTTWGAVAESPTSNLVGTSANKRSKELAESEAIRKCAAEGSRDCRTTVSYYNQCVAFSAPSSGKGRGSVNTAVDMDTVKAHALRSCRDTGGGGCIIAYSECSNPVFREY